MKFTNDLTAAFDEKLKRLALCNPSNIDHAQQQLVIHEVQLVLRIDNKRGRMKVSTQARKVYIGR